MESKWLWRFGVEREAFWRWVVMEKYGCNNPRKALATSALIPQKD